MFKWLRQDAEADDRNGPLPRMVRNGRRRIPLPQNRFPKLHLRMRPHADPIADLGNASASRWITSDADLASAQASIDELLKQANFRRSLGSLSAPELPVADPVIRTCPIFKASVADNPGASIDLLRDVDLNVKIELGRSRMLVEDVLKVGRGIGG